MGKVFAEITLKNSVDVSNAGRGIIPESDVRSLSVTALVDTGAMTLTINEEMRQKLGLSIEGTRIASLAGGAKMECKITEPVRIHWKNRDTACRAMVMPNGDALLGLLPLEDMDLIVDPVRHELTGAHGEEILTFIM